MTTPSFSHLKPPVPTAAASAAAAASDQSHHETQVLDGVAGYALVCGSLSAVAAAVWWTLRRRQGHGGGWARVFEVVALALLWYGCSVSLSLANKFVYTIWRGGFHFPLLVALVHMTVKGMGTLIIYYGFGYIRPLPKLRRDVFWKCMVPIGVAMGLDIGLSNWSAMLLPLSMYTVIKTSGIVWTFLLSTLLGLAPKSALLASCILIVCCGAVLAVWDR